MELDGLLDGLLKELHKVSNSASIIGEPADLNGSHMVPLLKVTLGFGTGATDLAGSRGPRDGNVGGGGAGGAITVEPKAFVVVGPDGVPQLLSMRGGKKAVLQHAVALPVSPAAPALPPPEKK